MKTIVTVMGTATTIIVLGFLAVIIDAENAILEYTALGTSFLIGAKIAELCDKESKQ